MWMSLLVKRDNVHITNVPADKSQCGLHVRMTLLKLIKSDLLLPSYVSKDFTLLWKPSRGDFIPFYIYTFHSFVKVHLNLSPSAVCAPF